MQNDDFSMSTKPQGLGKIEGNVEFFYYFFFWFTDADVFFDFVELDFRYVL